MYFCTLLQHLNRENDLLCSCSFWIQVRRVSQLICLTHGLTKDCQAFTRLFLSFEYCQESKTASIYVRETLRNSCIIIFEFYLELRFSKVLLLCDKSYFLRNITKVYNFTRTSNKCNKIVRAIHSVIARLDRHAKYYAPSHKTHYIKPYRKQNRTESAFSARKNIIWLTSYWGQDRLN